MSAEVPYTISVLPVSVVGLTELEQVRVALERYVDGKTDSIVSHFYKDWWWRVLYPDTKMKGFADYLNSLTIAYPEEDLNLGGLKMHWIAIFAIVSILSGIVASRMFKIEI